MVFLTEACNEARTQNSWATSPSLKNNNSCDWCEKEIEWVESHNFIRSKMRNLGCTTNLNSSYRRRRKILYLSLINFFLRESEVSVIIKNSSLHVITVLCKIMPICNWFDSSSNSNVAVRRSLSKIRSERYI